jgi:hypothetical protein
MPSERFEFTGWEVPGKAVRKAGDSYCFIATNQSTEWVWKDPHLKHQDPILLFDLDNRYSGIKLERSIFEFPVAGKACVVVAMRFAMKVQG